MRLIRDGEKGGRGVEVGGERLYTYPYTVPTRMTSALRWAAMRAILIFHNCEGRSHKTVSTGHNFWREKRVEADSNRGPSAYQPNAVPLGQTGSRPLRSSTLTFTQPWIASYCVGWGRGREGGVEGSGPDRRGRGGARKKGRKLVAYLSRQGPPASWRCLVT